MDNKESNEIGLQATINRGGIGTSDRKPLKDHMEAVGHKEAFDEYYVKHNLGTMEKLFAGYDNARLDNYLMVLEK